MNLSQKFPLGTLFLLSAALFVASTTEFLPIALLSPIADDLDVSTAAVGQLVTVFALSIVAFSIPLTVLTQRVPPKPLLLGTLCGIALMAVLSGVAPNFALLAIARLIGGGLHGLCAATTIAIMGAVVPHKQLGRAIAVTTAGSALTFIIGIPLPAVLAHVVGWRAVFLFSALTIVTTAALLAWRLPHISPHPVLTHETKPHWLRDRELWVLLGVTVLAVGTLAGQFSLYTYIAPWMTEALGASVAEVPLQLFAFGTASGVAVLFVTPLADLAPRTAFVTAAAVAISCVAALALLPMDAGLRLAAFALWGLAYGGMPGLLHAQLMRAASPRRRRLAGALQAMGGNVGLAAGSMVGGMVIDAGGTAQLPWVMLVSYGTVIVAVALSAIRRGDGRTGEPP